MADPMIRLAFCALNFFRLQSFEYIVFLSSPQGQLWRNEYSKPSAWPSLSTNTGLGRVFHRNSRQSRLSPRPSSRASIIGRRNLPTGRNLQRRIAGLQTTDKHAFAQARSWFGSPSVRTSKSVWHQPQKAVLAVHSVATVALRSIQITNVSRNQKKDLK